MKIVIENITVNEAGKYDGYHGFGPRVTRSVYDEDGRVRKWKNKWVGARRSV